MTAGKTLFVPTPKGKIEARVLFRDYDGSVRLVSKRRQSRAAAERALKAELANRQTAAGSGAVTSAIRVAELGEVWLEAPHAWSTGIARTYRSVVDNQVAPSVGDLRLREVTPRVVSRALRTIANRDGPSAAKSAKTCLSGMFALAIEDGAVSTRAVALDIPDLVDWMLATGCRIGEGLALRHALNADGKPTLDLEANTWEVNATIVRVPKRGLIVQPRPKTAAG